jgi:lipopolysaccharide transport system ATP-binding protein
VIELEYWNLEPDNLLNLSLVLINEQGIPVFNTGPIYEPVWNGRPFPIGLFRSTCYIPGDLLNDGTYRILLLLVKNQKYIIHRQQDILLFEVHDTGEGRGSWFGKWNGVIRPNLEWATECLNTGTITTEKSPPHASA